MAKHIVKYDHEDGKPLARNRRIFWCGVDASKVGFDFTFTDAQHAILSIEQGSLVVPCEQCLNAIVEVIKDN